MPTELIMPRLGLTMDEGTIVAWLVAEGQPVTQGEPVLEVETDKVVVEVEAPASGTMGAHLVKEGARVPVGTVLASIHGPSSAFELPSPSSDRRPVPDEAEPVPDKSPLQPKARPGRTDHLRPFSSPRARTRARQLGVDWRSVPGSGPGGRVVERDVLSSNAVDLHRAGGAVGSEPGIVAGLADRPLPPGASTWPEGRSTLSVTATVSMTALLPVHHRLQSVVEQQTGYPLTLGDWLVRATALAMVQTGLAIDIVTEEMPDPDQDAVSGESALKHRRSSPSIGLAGPAGMVVMDLWSLGRAPLSEIASRRGQAEEQLAKARPKISDQPATTVLLRDLSQSRIETLFMDQLPQHGAVLALGRMVVQPPPWPSKPSSTPSADPGSALLYPEMAQSITDLDSPSVSSARWQAPLSLTCDSRVIAEDVALEFLNALVAYLEEPFLLLA